MRALPANLLKRMWSGVRILQITFDLWHVRHMIAMLDNPVQALSPDVLRFYQIQRGLRIQLAHHKKIYAERRREFRGRA